MRRPLGRAANPSTSHHRVSTPSKVLLLGLVLLAMAATTAVQAFILQAARRPGLVGQRIVSSKGPLWRWSMAGSGLRRALSSSSAEGGAQQDTSVAAAPQEGGGAGEDNRKPPKEKLRAIRQHVNPLSRSYQQPVELPEGWVRAAFKDPTKPFHIDIGAARGRFCVDMALAHPEMNFLGLEIRRPCVEEAFKKRDRSGADAGGNCHFLACNANVDLARVVADVHKEGAEVVRYSIQFPDPHFKKKHKKRRMVQPGLVDVCCSTLKPDGGEVFLQSDVEEVAQSMRECFWEDSRVKDGCAPGEWMPENPLGVPTEREKLTLGRGDPVFRTLFKKGV